MTRREHHIAPLGSTLSCGDLGWRVPPISQAVEDAKCPSPALVDGLSRRRLYKERETFQK